MTKTGFGARVRTTREARNMSVELLAHECGVRAVTVERWEAGKNEPRIDDAGKVAVALGVSLDELVGIRGEKETAA